jgi:hypothetical protein
MLLPVIGLVQVGEQCWADRYTYLPSIGFMIALVFAADDLCRNVRLHGTRTMWRAFAAGMGALTTLVAAALAVMTFVELGYWRDNQTQLLSGERAVRPHVA